MLICGRFCCRIVVALYHAVHIPRNIFSYRDLKKHDGRQPAPLTLFRRAFSNLKERRMQDGMPNLQEAL